MSGGFLAARSVMMAKSGKIQDAATAALSAIEEALDLGAPPAPTENAKESPEGDKAEAINAGDASAATEPTSQRAPALQPPNSFRARS